MTHASTVTHATDLGSIAIRKLRTRFILLGTFVLILVLGMRIIQVRNEKQRLALAIVSSVLRNLEVGDLREVAFGLQRGIKGSFTGVKLLLPTSPDKNEIKLGETTDRYTSLTAMIEIDALSKAKLGGSVIFFYDLFDELLWQVAFLIPTIFIVGGLVYQDAVRRVLENFNVQELARISEAKTEVALQVAHDIRSPIAVLEFEIGQLSELYPSTNSSLKESVERINEIANDLLRENASSQVLNSFTMRQISNAILSVSSEKQMFFRNKLRIAFDTDEIIQDKLKGAKLNLSVLKRIISNLINNSAEANATEVRIRLEVQGAHMTLSILDNGDGIPLTVLKKIGKRGLSGGSKANGSGHGLGVSHAFKTVEEWKGRIVATNIATGGTSIRIVLPVLMVEDESNDKTKYFADGRLDYVQVVLLDNDPQIRKIWELSASKHAVNLRTFGIADALFEIVTSLQQEAVFFLDFGFGTDQPNGIQIAERLVDLGFKNIYLATGHSKSSLPISNAVISVVGKEPPWMFPNK